MDNAHLRTALPAALTSLILALGTTAVPEIAQACHQGAKHIGGGPCGGGGDPGPVATNPTLVRWEGPDMAEATDRSCLLEFANSDGTAGHYTCVLDGSEVTFALDGAAELDKRGRVVDQPSGLCDGFVATVMAPNTSYEVDWSGLCTGGDGCDIRIKNWYFNAAGAPLPDETGLIFVEGFGTASGTSNPNPFPDTLGIVIDRVLITVKADGSNKTLGFCVYDPVAVTFGSTPDS